MAFVVKPLKLLGNAAEGSCLDRLLWLCDLVRPGSSLVPLIAAGFMYTCDGSFPFSVGFFRSDGQGKQELEAAGSRSEMCALSSLHRYFFFLDFTEILSLFPLRDSLEEHLSILLGTFSDEPVKQLCSLIGLLPGETSKFRKSGVPFYTSVVTLL